MANYKIKKDRQSLRDIEIANNMPEGLLCNSKDCEFSPNLKGIIKWSLSKFDERHILYALLFAFVSALLNEFSPGEYLNIFGIDYKLDLAKVPIILGGAYFGPLLTGLSGIASVMLSLLFREQHIGELFNTSSTAGELINDFGGHNAAFFVALNFFLYGFITGIVVGWVHCFSPKVKKMAGMVEVLFFVMAGLIMTGFFIGYVDVKTSSKVQYLILCASILIIVWVATKFFRNKNLRAVRALDEILLTEIILSVVVTMGVKTLWYIIGDYHHYASTGKHYKILSHQIIQMPLDIAVTAGLVFILLTALGRLNLEDHHDDDH